MIVPCVAPAAKKVCYGGKPIVLLVNENNGKGQLSNSEVDFLSLYNPDKVYLIGLSSIDPQINAQISTISPKEELDASIKIATTFWSASKTVVVASNDYGRALLASTIASRLNLPLLYVESSSVPESVKNAIRKLSSSEAIIVANQTMELEGLFQSTVLLSNESQVAEFIMQQGYIEYLILTNPLDRNQGVVRKLSLISSILAAGRGAIILPVEFIQESCLFETDSITQYKPDGVPEGATVNLKTPTAQFHTVETTEPPRRAPNAT